MISSAVIFSALELGFLYSLVALALMLSYKILGIADLTTDGTFTLGCAVSAVVALSGHPVLALPAAMVAGAVAGFVTATLQTRWGVPSILAGIITNTALYTVNLAVMGFSSNVNLLQTKTIYTMAKRVFGSAFPYKLLISAVIAIFFCILMVLFLHTRIGLSIHATGDNPDMVRASSINTAVTISVGLAIANSLTALSGALLAQYQRTADINLGTGMVVIGLASLIIGQSVIRGGKVLHGVIGVVVGSILYRFMIAIALRMDLPAEFLKLISAVIVAVTIALPTIRSNLKLRSRKKEADHA